MANLFLHFPLWWYATGLKWWQRFFKNLLVFLNSQLAVTLMATMMLTPLWQDTSLLGRILSFVFRSVRVIIGTVVMTVTVLAMGFWLLIWLLAPPLLMAILKWPGAVFLALIWTIDIFRQWQKQMQKYSGKKLIKLVKKSSGRVADFKLKLLKLPAITDLLNRIELSPTALTQLAEPITWPQWQKLSQAQASEWRDKYIEAKHFLASWLKLTGFKIEVLKEAVDWLKSQKQWSRVPFLWDAYYQDRPIGGINRDLTGIPTPTLDKFSTDLTKLASRRQLPEMFGKETVLNQLSQILSQDQQNNALVIGPPGSGKSTLIKSLAQEIVRGVGFQKLRFKRLVSLDVAQLAAGADSAALNERVTKMIAEIKAAGNIILFVDEVHNLASINQDKPETADVMIALEPALSEGLFQFIGATSTGQYKKLIEPNEAFSRLFTVVELNQASAAQTLDLLTYLAYLKEQRLKLSFSLPALHRIVEAAHLYSHDRVLPDAAVQLLDEVTAAAQTKQQKLITTAGVDKLIEQKTKIPVGKVDFKEKTKLLNLEASLHRQVIGQDRAIKAIADAVRRLRTQLKPVGKPIASFLFAGPTGVGKTETAKALANQFFGSSSLMIRIDMSEYQQADSINRLIGPPPGSKDYLSGGQLTEAVRHQPYAVVLLDEIEKADPKILNLFLQVFDEARLTDNQGKLVDFNNTIIIATTNVPPDKIETHFPPEWLNRFSEIIVFSALNLNQTEQVVKLKLEQLAQTLKTQEILVKFEPQLIKSLAKVGFSTKWGGRQIDRVIAEKVVNDISQKILKGEIAAGLAFTYGS